MGANKKENTVLEEESFSTEILSEELHEAIASVSDESAEDFIQTLKKEMEESQVKVVEKQIPETKKEVKRVFDDKTAVISDEVVSTSSLDNVTSLGDVKAGIVQKSIQRNPAIDLKNADYIKFAQAKITRLDKELAALRSESQELAAAGSHFKELAEERALATKSMEAKIGELESTAKEEKKILNDALDAKETKISALQGRLEDLEIELESKYNRVHLRERELESRLEILKQEQGAVTSSKDEMILRVKKQNDVLTAELERVRVQSQRTSSNLQNKEDALRRTIKALKLSLTMLESQKHD